jgi:hypothetical protein
VDVERAKVLRQSWKSKGNPPCSHRRVDPESNASGYFTGNVICKACGAQVEMESHANEQQGEGTQIRPAGWGRYALYASMGFIAAAVPVFTVWYKQRRRKPFKSENSDPFLP